MAEQLKPAPQILEEVEQATLEKVKGLKEPAQGDRPDLTTPIRIRLIRRPEPGRAL
ncbi:MAG: hypothetical protein UV41_C0049G0008 [Candidatus Daviesbacteria bacterium GW2011_GWA2_42_7]|uniref:Uncharacterized protein n=2 Tax=Candidatus Daviesiibacteriota TaxID=1752718 RepID=A0A0G1D2I0_9BACT|nr:MAG: hypothetical protein UV33_C0013G0016 [Candidatus Daviesbacteria bacterium GW2011_GWA1_42_6]KKS69626.1 MAG: hypothetical protein UV41_C0049G0008 [Candidatus Daviesbacteria bacterium GW2011_GWA2_42_7]